MTGGSATLVNGTFAGNRAGQAQPPRFGSGDEAISGQGGAAAALAPGTLAITFSTFAGNAAGSGPGGPGLAASAFGAQVGASILADAGGACATPTPASAPNVVLPGDVSCPGARISGDPRLAPGAGSAAIDALVGLPCPATDARGLPRPVFAGCDAGAVEVQVPPPVAAPAGTVAAPLRPGLPARAARLSALRLTPAAFRAAGRKPLGATVRYRLSAAARVVFTV